MIKLFLVLGAAWGIGAVYQFGALSGDPDRVHTVIQFMGLAAANLGVAGFLEWRRVRRERPGR